MSHDRRAKSDSGSSKDLDSFKRVYDSLTSEDKQSVKEGLRKDIARLDSEIRAINRDLN